MTLGPHRSADFGLGEGHVIAERYELAGILGSGAGTLVFRAHDFLSGDEIAVKVFRPAALQNLLPHLRIGARVLDIGCGSGLLLGLAVATGAEIKGVGIDMSVPAINLARELIECVPASGWKGSLEFHCLPAEAEWPAGEFDAVCAIDVLHHVPPAMRCDFVMRAARKVAKEGIFVYKDIASRPLWRATANRLHDLAVAREWIHYVPVARVEEWAAGAGLELTHSEDVNRLWYPHELRVFRRVS